MAKSVAQPKTRLLLAVQPHLYQQIAKLAGENDETVTAWIVDAILRKLADGRQERQEG